MGRRVTIVMTNDELRLLQALAERDLRSSYDQVRYLIREAAVNRGLLSKDLNIKPSPLDGLCNGDSER